MSKLVTGKDHKISKFPGLVGGWTKYRDIPEPPKESFRNWWKKEAPKASRRDSSERVDIQALIEQNKGKVVEAHQQAEQRGQTIAHPAEEKEQ